jgi:hypothetical protein
MKAVVVRSGIVGVVSAVLLGGCATSDAERGFVEPDAGGGQMGQAGEPAGEAGQIAEMAGMIAPAGTGGMAGSLAGTGAGGAGVGGAGVGGSAASGGGGGSAAGGGGSAGAMGGGEGGCPTQYTMATHIVINVSWDGTLAVASGSGKVHVWSRTKFNDSGDSATLESVSCGTVLPDITTTQIGDGGSKILPEIPNASWDNPNMPTFAGTATRNGTTLNINSGTALLGLSLSNVNAAWPAATAITPVDHDGDGKPGISAIPRNGGGYKMPPTSTAKTSRADKLYLAIRNVMTLTGPADGCPQTYSGTANVTKFENHVIGCHVSGGGECSSSQSKFVDDNRTIFTVNSATYESKVVDDAATCADVRTALPLQ